MGDPVGGWSVVPGSNIIVLGNFFVCSLAVSPPKIRL
jgi:hypothetical protein